MPQNSELLCLECALCCNGALFADVQLRACDRAELLAEAGVPVVSSKRSSTQAQKLKLGQPCAALCGNRCRFYSLRPAHCREFECALLRRFHAGGVSFAQALMTIRATRRKLERVEKLFESLGDTNAQLPLKKRLATLARRLESGAVGAGTEAAAHARLVATYARLTAAVHDLHLRLARSFYPGSG